MTQSIRTELCPVRLLLLTGFSFCLGLNLSGQQPSQKDQSKSTEKSVQELLAKADQLRIQRDIAGAIAEAKKATALDPSNKQAWYAVANLSTFVSGRDAQPETSIQACTRLIAIGEKPFFALGMSHYRLNKSDEALAAFIKSRNQLVKNRPCQDRTLSRNDVELLYFFLTELFTQIDADDIAVALFRECPTVPEKLSAIHRTVPVMMENKCWDSLIQAAEIGIPDTRSPEEKKDLLFYKAYGEAMAGYFQACQRTTAQALAIQTQESELEKQALRLPQLLDSMKEKFANSSAPYRHLPRGILEKEIASLKSDNPIDDRELKLHTLEQIRRIQSSLAAQPDKNATALGIVNDLHSRLPDSPDVSELRHRLLFLNDKFDELEQISNNGKNGEFWALVINARKAINRGDAESGNEIVDMARQAFEFAPTDPIARTILIEAYLLIGDVQNAIQLARDGLTAGHGPSFSTLADVYEFNGQHLQAFKLNSSGRKMNNANQPMFAFKRATNLHELGMENLALEQFRIAFDNGFSAPGVRIRAIEICKDRALYQDALRFCDQEISILLDREADEQEKQLYPVYLMRAEICLAMGDLKLARETIGQLDKMKSDSDELLQQKFELKKLLDP